MSKILQDSVVTQTVLCGQLFFQISCSARVPKAHTARDKLTFVHKNLKLLPVFQLRTKPAFLK